MEASLLALAKSIYYKLYNIKRNKHAQTEIFLALKAIPKQAYFTEM